MWLVNSQLMPGCNCIINSVISNNINCFPENGPAGPEHVEGWNKFFVPNLFCCVKIIVS